MKKNQKSLITLAILMAASPLYAATISEVEPNDTYDVSQYVNGSNPADISGAITTGTSLTSNDVDFYSIYANAGDEITIDIDNAYNDSTWTGVDTLVGLFDSSGTLVDQNDDSGTIDPGSYSIYDSYIGSYVAQTSGIFYVAVTNSGHTFSNNFGVDNVYGTTGSYEVIITKVTPVTTTSASTTTTTTISSSSGTTSTTTTSTASTPVSTASSTTTTSTAPATVSTASSTQHIDLEIRPGTREFTPINPNANGVIPVALLSKRGFNAMDINPATITFGARGYEQSLSKCNPHGQDVNGDGLPDMLCFFNNQATALKMDSLQGFARGTTRNGQAFEGHGISKIKIVPTQKVRRK